CTANQHKVHARHAHTPGQHGRAPIQRLWGSRSPPRGRAGGGGSGVRFKVMIKPGADFTGALKVWMNNQVLFDLSSIKTRYVDTGQGLISYIEQTGYGSGLTPTPAVHYVDDVTISLGRMPYP